MNTTPPHRHANHEGRRYETIFCIFLVMLAFLWRDNPDVVYPDILYMFLGLLVLNLAAGLLLKWRPARPALAAAAVLANCALITGILAHSGGPRSNFWVLYLLPIYTASLLLNGRELVWITIGAVACNAAYVLHAGPRPDEAAWFALAFKSGGLLFAAAAVWRVVRRERGAAAALAQQRRRSARTAEELRRRSGELESSQRMADVGMLSAGASHDMKSPLTVILATAGILLERGTLPDALRPDIQRIRNAAVFCRRILSEVLDSSREQRFAPEPCRVDELIAHALELLAARLARGGIRLRKRLDDDLPPVNVGPLLIERVIMNLVGNAADAMPSGGELRLCAYVDRSPMGNGHWIRIVFEDTGTGIADDVMSGLFKPFKTTKPKGRGTGLGLYMCREIAAQHGGMLHAENMPAGGARFTLSLPRAAAAPTRNGALNKI